MICRRSFRLALNVWAYFRQLSGKEIFAAAAYRYDEEVLFTINYRNDITTACLVEYGGVRYNVNRIDTFEGYKQDITLYCKRKQSGRGLSPPPISLRLPCLQVLQFDLCHKHFSVLFHVLPIGLTV